MPQEIPVFKVKTYVKSEAENTFEVNEKEDFISQESPLQISLRKSQQSELSENVVITMRTPGQDTALALGFLLSEGIISSYNEIVSIKVNENKIDILLAEASSYDLKSVERNFFASSSCGVCSKTNLGDIQKDSHYLPFSSNLRVQAPKLFGIQKKIMEQEGMFSKTGSMHSAALLDSELNFIGKWEDVGRHNALDKLIGHSLMNDSFPLSENVLLLSGRISFELVQKASMAGIPFIIAKGAPSSLAIEEAYAQSMCLVGFAKNRSFNVYCGFERIIE